MRRIDFSTDLNRPDQMPASKTCPWLIVSAIALTGTSLHAQEVAAPPPVVATPALPAEPVITPPVPVAPPATTTPPAPTPPVIQAPVVKPPVKKPAPIVQRYKKADPGDKLRPGQFVWEQRAAYKNPLKIIVVLDFQRLYVFDGEELVAFTTVSSGKKGYETPTGIYPILQKNIDHFSNIYDNAPMPFMQRLTWDGIALHAGAIPGVPASHGCIRMPKTFAKLLFGATKLDQQVIVIQNTSKSSQPSDPPKVEPKPVEPKPVDPAPVVPKPATPSASEPVITSF